jgi:hypothetical protein
MIQSSVVIATVQRAEKSFGGLHQIKTRLGIFRAQEDCENLALLKPGVLAIFHITMKEPPRLNVVPATWQVFKIQPYPTKEQIYIALKLS